MLPARILGGRAIGTVGLGCGELSFLDVPQAEASRTVHAALDAGTRLLDTAAAYTPDAARVSHNELLVAEALRTWSGPRDEVVVATKGGHKRLGQKEFEVCGRPDYVRTQVDESARALGLDELDMWLLHWPDPNVALAETVGALDELRREGSIRHIGLSNVTVEQLDEAARITRIDAVENRFSLLSQSQRPVLDWCTANGAAFLAYSPLGGMGRAGGLTVALPELVGIAVAHRATPHQVALSWLVHQSPACLPIPGTTKAERAAGNAGAGSIELTVDELSVLDAAVAAYKQAR